MQRSMLIASLIALSGCAGRATAPPPPPMVRCDIVAGTLYCEDPNGKHLPPIQLNSLTSPKVECFPASDWEARKNWENLIKCQ